MNKCHNNKEKERKQDSQFCLHMVLISNRHRRRMARTL